MAADIEARLARGKHGVDSHVLSLVTPIARPCTPAFRDFPMPSGTSCRTVLDSASEAGLASTTCLSFLPSSSVAIALQTLLSASRSPPRWPQAALRFPWTLTLAPNPSRPQGPRKLFLRHIHGNGRKTQALRVSLPPLHPTGTGAAAAPQGSPQGRAATNKEVKSWTRRIRGPCRASGATWS